MINLGTKVRYMLNDKGVTQTQFGEITGINRTTLMPSRRKKNKWRKTTIYAAACFFGLTVEELVAGTDMEDEF